LSSAETDKLGEPFLPTMLDKRNVPSNQMKRINEMKFSHSRTRSVEESWRGEFKKKGALTLIRLRLKWRLCC